MCISDCSGIVSLALFNLKYRFVCLQKQLGLIKQVYQAYSVLQKQADGSIDKALGIVADAARGERTQAANTALAPSVLCFSLPCLRPGNIQVHCLDLPMPCLLP